MYKFVFTYLVKQNHKTWSDFEVSLKLLYKNILKKLNCDYKILIFCEGNPIPKVKNLISYFSNKKNINIIIKEISLKAYVKRRSRDKYIKYFPHASDCRLTFSLGYRDKCKFFAYDVFFDKNLNGVE